MFFSLKKILWRFRAYKRVKYLSENGLFAISKSVAIPTHSTSSIIIKDKCVIGFFNPRVSSLVSHLPDTIISIGENGVLECNGKVNIYPGTTIKIGKNAHLIFEGNNIIAHNSIILCNRKIIIGKNSAISWNTTLIDDDNHTFYKPDGRALKKIPHSLVIGENVGVQMNVSIPAGVTIGNNTIVSANTVVRQDLPPDSLVYTNNEIVTKKGYTTGFQFASGD